MDVMNDLVYILAIHEKVIHISSEIMKHIVIDFSRYNMKQVLGMDRIVIDCEMVGFMSVLGRNAKQGLPLRLNP